MKIFKATNDVCHGVLWNTHDCFSTYYEVVVSTSKQFRAGCTDFDPETSQEQPNSWECMERSQTHCKQQISPQVYGGFVDIGPLILMKHFKNKSYAHGERLKINAHNIIEFYSLQFRIYIFFYFILFFMFIDVIVKQNLNKSY